MKMIRETCTSIATDPKISLASKEELISISEKKYEVIEDDVYMYILGCIHYDIITDYLIHIFSNYILDDFIDTENDFYNKVQNLYKNFEFSPSRPLSKNLYNKYNNIRPVGRYMLLTPHVSDCINYFYNDEEFDNVKTIFVDPYSDLDDKNNMYIMYLNVNTYNDLPAKAYSTLKLQHTSSKTIYSSFLPYECSSKMPSDTYWVQLHMHTPINNIPSEYYEYTWSYAYTHNLKYLIKKCEEMYSSSLLCISTIYKYADPEFYVYASKIDPASKSYFMYKYLILRMCSETWDSKLYSVFEHLLPVHKQIVVEFAADMRCSVGAYSQLCNTDTVYDGEFYSVSLLSFVDGVVVEKSDDNKVDFSIHGVIVYTSDLNLIHYIVFKNTNVGLSANNPYDSRIVP